MSQYHPDTSAFLDQQGRFAQQRGDTVTAQAFVNARLEYDRLNGQALELYAEISGLRRENERLRETLNRYIKGVGDLATLAVQPNGATGWIDNAVTPPGESVERVLVAYPTGLVETTQAHYVRLYPTNYPWWMPLPVAPDPTPQPQPDAVASTFADCETAMGMEYTTPPCACAEYYPELPHHPDCPTRNADPTTEVQK